MRITQKGTNMTLQIQDRVKETTTTTGTGDITLAGAMKGFRAFGSVCADGDTCWYALQAVDAIGNPSGAWEVGVGTYHTTPNTLTRTTILASSNAGAAVNLPAGTTQCWIDLPAERILSLGSPTLSGLTDVNVTEGAGIDKFALCFDNGSGKWIAEARPYDLVMFAPGIPAGGALMARVIVPRVATFPSGLTGSYVSATVAATAAAALTLARNGTAIGTINFAAGATSGTFTFSSPVTTAAGDVLTITNQATADATLANISITLAGTR